MPPDEHQRERMRAWVQAYSDCGAELPETLAMFADASLAEFDKRFPAPALPVPDQSAMGMAVAGTILAQTAELATLREKARMWDAVASGKIILDHYDGNGWRCWTFGGTATAYFKSATEAVQAAIEAGALGPPTSDAWALK